MSSQLAVIGLGPGDPELITLKGLRLLQAASIIFVPRSDTRPGSLAQQIAGPHLDLARQRIVELPLAMARENEATSEETARQTHLWDEAAQMMAREIPAEGVAAYLVLGDPSLYGTFGRIREQLAVRRPDVAIEIVPGIHSYSAAAALAGQPLATGDERVAIVPAMYEADPQFIRRLLTEFDTVVLMKAGQALTALDPILREAGVADQTFIVERIGLPKQRVFRGLSAVVGEQLGYFSLAIVPGLRRP